VIQADSILARRPDVRFRWVDREGVVLMQEQARVLGLNETGMKVLERLDGSASVGAILRGLAADLSVPTETLEKDVLPFLEILMEKGALEELVRREAR
jgi:hypothetical protein